MGLEQGVTQDFEKRWHFNSAIAQIMELTNEIYLAEPLENGVRPEIRKEVLQILTLLLAPMTPHIAEEMWEMLGNKDGLWNAAWPVLVDEQLELAKDNEVEIPVQVNGRVRTALQIPAGATESDVVAKACPAVKLVTYEDTGVCTARPCRCASKTVIQSFRIEAGVKPRPAEAGQQTIPLPDMAMIPCVCRSKERKMNLDSNTLSERVTTSFSKLTVAAKDLNKVSDELGKAISSIDSILQRLNLGVPTWTQIQGGEDPHSGMVYWSRDVGYAKIGNRWGIALCTREGDYSSPDEERCESWLFNDAPRWLRVEGIEKIPDLLEELIKNMEETTKKIKGKIDQAKQLADSLALAAAGKPIQKKPVQDRCCRN